MIEDTTYGLGRGANAPEIPLDQLIPSKPLQERLRELGLSLDRRAASITKNAHGFSAVKDSGSRESFSTGSVRDTADGKGRFDLIPALMLRRLAQHYENGAKKYGDNNWKLGQPLHRYLDSALRHYCAVVENDQGEDHAAAIIWNVTAYIWTRNEIENGRLPKELDDINHTTQKEG